ncbi:MAG: SIS domain-containing protein [Acaryochloridaceae cyanobacterium SU_2_1]|nr:SIS domain-containing protein [Acaryochloridaceae cyanobacterium SU_2_1]NJM95736.1 SIS domain-containing protein [Acaryochloridaceae cyanobacterium CSU_5_19]
MSYQSDIFDQPQLLHSLVQTYQGQDRLWSQITALGQANKKTVILTGMGASFNALYPLWLYLNQQGCTALHIETSALIHYLPRLLATSGLLVGVSQSGESAEICRLVAEIQDQRSSGQLSPTVLAVTNGRENTLARHSDISLATQAGTEVGIATKTYTSSMLLLHFVARALIAPLQAQDFERGDAIATSLATYFHQKTAALQAAALKLQNSSYIAIIGRGPALATANNAALMFKEGIRLPAEGYSGGQFRHGPREVITADIGVIVLTSPGPTLALNQRLAADIQAYGGQLVCIGQPPGHDLNACHLPLPLVDEFLHPLLEIAPIQLLIGQLARQQNITLGEFRWSGKIVHQE